MLDLGFHTALLLSSSILPQVDPLLLGLPGTPHYATDSWTSSPPNNGHTDASIVLPLLHYR